MQVRLSSVVISLFICQTMRCFETRLMQARSSLISWHVMKPCFGFDRVVTTTRYDLLMKACTLEIVPFVCFYVRNVRYYFCFKFVCVSFNLNHSENYNETRQVEKMHFCSPLGRIVSYVVLCMNRTLTCFHNTHTHSLKSENGRFYVERRERTLPKCSCDSIQDLESKTSRL